MASPRLPWNRPTGVVIGVLALALSGFLTLVSPDPILVGPISSGEKREPRSPTRTQVGPFPEERPKDFGGEQELRALAEDLEYQEPVWRERFRRFSGVNPPLFFPRLPDPEAARAQAVERAARELTTHTALAGSMVTALSVTKEEALAARIGELLSNCPKGVLPGLLAQALSSDPSTQLRSLECLLRWVERLETLRLDATMIEAVARFQMGSEHSRIRLAAVRLEQALGIRTEAAVEAILLVLDDPDPEVRAAAASAIGSWRFLPERCVLRLAEKVSDIDLEVRVAAANALGAFGRSAVGGEPVLGEAAGHAQVRVAVAATRALGRLDSVSANSLGALLRNVHRPEAVLRATAVTALGRLGEEAGAEAAEAVAGALLDGDAFVRRSAVQALAEYGPLGATGIDSLIGILRSGEEPMQILAAEALGAIGPSAARAIPVLTAARNNNQSVMSRPVVEALARIQAVTATGPEGGR